MLRKIASPLLLNHSQFSFFFFNEYATSIPLIGIKEDYSESVYSLRCFLCSISINNENLTRLFTEEVLKNPLFHRSVSRACP